MKKITIIFLITISILFLSSCNPQDIVTTNDEGNVIAPSEQLTDNYNNPINAVLYREYHNKLMIDYTNDINELEEIYDEKKNEYIVSIYKEYASDIYTKYLELNEEYDNCALKYKNDERIIALNQQILDIEGLIKSETDTSQKLEFEILKTTYALQKKNIMDEYNLELNNLHAKIGVKLEELREVYFEHSDEINKVILEYEIELKSKRIECLKNLNYEVARLNFAYENGLDYNVGE